MAKRPMPVPRNRGAAAGLRPPRGKPRRTGPKPLTVFAVVLLVLLLVCGCMAVLASTGRDGSHQSHLPAIGARSNYTYPTPSGSIAQSVGEPTATSQPRDHGHPAMATTGGHRLNPR